MYVTFIKSYCADVNGSLNIIGVHDTLNNAINYLTEQAKINKDTLEGSFGYCGVLNKHYDSLFTDNGYFEYGYKQVVKR